MTARRRTDLTYPGCPVRVTALGCTLGLLWGCTAVPPAPPWSPDTSPLIASETVAGLNTRRATREECTAQLGEPSMVSADGRFLEYDRSATFRNLSHAVVAGRPGSAFTSAEPDVIYYQLVGVWLDRSGHVVAAHDFVSPCASCIEGEMLATMTDLDDWMRRSEAAAGSGR